MLTLLLQQTCCLLWLLFSSLSFIFYSFRQSISQSRIRRPTSPAKAPVPPPKPRDAEKRPLLGGREPAFLKTGICKEDNKQNPPDFASSLKTMFFLTHFLSPKPSSSPSHVPPQLAAAAAAAPRSAWLRPQSRSLGSSSR